MLMLAEANWILSLDLLIALGVVACALGLTLRFLWRSVQPGPEALDSAGGDQAACSNCRIAEQGPQAARRIVGTPHSRSTAQAEEAR